MNPERLLKHFDQIAEAPDAVPRLRRFILDLAVRGKLVEQDPAEEPASELLKRIKAKKERLTETGEIPQEKTFLPIKEAELQFGIPQSWKWARLRNVASYIQRGKSPQYAGGKGRPVISQKCVQWDGLHLEWAKAITPESFESYEPIRFLRDGDLLWNSTGTGTIGRVVRVGQSDEGLVCDGHVTVVRCLLVDERFICIWLRSDHVYGTIEERAAGATNQVELTASIANNQITPIPPLPEQHRIVAKVDELMTLCDEVEAAQQKRERRRDRLVAATLNGFGMDIVGRDVSPKRPNGKDGIGKDVTGRDGIGRDGIGRDGSPSRPDDSKRPQSIGRDRSPNGPQSIENGGFGETALPKFFLTHLPRLTTRPEHIQQLRQTILNLAVRGKLVPQDPQDEPTDSLISCIEAERKRRGSAGEPVNTQALAYSEDGGFPIPQSWRWGRLGFVTNVLMGQSPPGETYNTHGEGIPLINGPVEFSEGPFGVTVLNQYTTAPTKLCKKGDLLLCVRGSTTGRTNIAGFDACIGRGVAALQPFYADQYVRLFVWLWRDKIIEMGRGIAFPSISRQQIEDLPIPIPPLAEQNRIVAKVDELMAICDELEAWLTKTTTARRQLLEVSFHEALNSDSRVSRGNEDGVAI